MASNAAASSQDKAQSDKLKSPDANPPQVAQSKTPVDSKPAQPPEKTADVKPQSAKPAANGDERMQQLMTLWTQFQKAEQQHTAHIRDMEERLQRAEKTIEHFGKFCGEYHLLWKVKDFRRCYEEGATQAREVIYSPAFDTHRNGYKLQLSICPAGDGKGRGVAMSVFFAILKGPYDALLSWPFSCPVTITLLDQMSGRDEQHEGPARDIARTFTPNPRPENEPFLGRPTENRNICLGFPKFVPLKELFDGRFICDDAIYFKVHVDISRLMQPQQQQQQQQQA